VDSGNERAAKRPRANPRPFDPPDPSTFDPISSPRSTPPSLHLLYRLLTAAQPTHRRDRPNHLPAMGKNGGCIRSCLQPISLILLFPPLLPVSPSGAVVPLPTRRQPSRRRKKIIIIIKNRFKKRENAVLYSYETVIVVD